jgi:hypothetical protein
VGGTDTESYQVSGSDINSAELRGSTTTGVRKLESEMHTVVACRNLEMAIQQYKQLKTKKVHGRKFGLFIDINCFLFWENEGLFCDIVSRL